MELEDFNYFLLEEMIAQRPANPRDSSRLMVLDGDVILDKTFRDILDYVEAGDVLVVNETKVSKAKICGKKLTGGPAEIVLCEKIDDFSFKCRIKARNVKIGSEYLFEDDLRGIVVDADYDIFSVKFNKEITNEMTEKYFELPTPPYVAEKLQDDSEYQTIYSKKEGSLAAPTAGLHFTTNLFEEIEKKGVIIARICLNVDFGTFFSVRGKIEEHKMHEEYFEISDDTADKINKRKGRLIVVGTTSVRALESSADKSGKINPVSAKTGIFIYPGYKFKTKIDAMITNFHLPKSTLLMLVSAYFGREKILNAYEHAKKNGYRFYSLGDAMILLNSQPQ